MEREIKLVEDFSRLNHYLLAICMNPAAQQRFTAGQLIAIEELLHILEEIRYEEIPIEIIPAFGNPEEYGYAIRLTSDIVYYQNRLATIGDGTYNTIIEYISCPTFDEILKLLDNE